MVLNTKVSTNSNKNVAIVEWLNQTLKTTMWKYFYTKRAYQ